MELSLGKIISLSIGVVFSILLIVSFVVYPEMGEKILYGKHPPVKDLEHSETIIPTVDVENKEITTPEERLEYSAIMTSGNDKCIEYANGKSDGDLNKFVDEFNYCNSQ